MAKTFNKPVSLHFNFKLDKALAKTRVGKAGRAAFCEIRNEMTYERQMDSEER